MSKSDDHEEGKTLGDLEALQLARDIAAELVIRDYSLRMEAIDRPIEEIRRELRDGGIDSKAIVDRIIEDTKELTSEADESTKH